MLRLHVTLKKNDKEDILMGTKTWLHRGLAMLLALLMVLTGIPTRVAATQPEAETSAAALEEDPVVEEPEDAPETLSEETSFDGILQGSEEAELAAISTDTPAEDDLVRVIVELEEAPLTEISGALSDGTLTTMGLTQQTAILERHDAIQAEIQALAGEAQVQVRYDYTLLANGFSLECPYGLLEEIQAMDGVKSAEVCQVYSLPTEPQMSSSNDMIGSSTAWNLGLDGSGMVVAVLDTGLDTDHAAFAQDPQTQTLTQETLAEILANNTLRVERIQSVTAQDLYLSGKVPFVFDYADGDTDVNHYGGSDHGTHVAGTVAGDPADDTISGVAPQAQLVIMKVFPNGSTGANSDDILAALEDCVTLGVDVVNLSLGSPAGFTQRPDLLTTMDVYSRLEEAGIIVAAAAGNEYSAAYENQWGTDLSLASNPDYGIVGAPSTYTQTLSVASAENEKIRSAYFQVGERKITFTDTAGTYDPDGQFITVLGGQTLSYVVIPGYGEASDYEGLDVKGKVALVSRGSTTFPEKQEVARAQGAVACIVYNNDVGMINMAITEYPIPAIFISQEDGKAMIAAAENGVGSLYVSKDTFEAEAEDGGTPSDFSSWGTTAQLEITPDLMAPGGNIYSSTDNGTYGLMSGTSMATPHVSGASALVLQYIRKQNNALLTEEQFYDLLMSTAEPVKTADGTAYSPRKQGAGLVNLASALSTRAYIQVAGQDRPKLELGDDPEKTGVYTLTFEVVNFGTESLSYTIVPQVLTETASVEGQYDGQDVSFAAQTPRNITEQVTWTTNQSGNVVTVPAGGTVSVTVTITLSDSLKQELSTTFQNGIYIEGYVTLVQQATQEGVTGCDLSIPYLAFYGNWGQAPVIDTGYYWELLAGEASWSSQYTNYAGSMITGSTSFYVFGGNPYVSGLDYYQEHNTLSPLRTDGYFDKVDLIYTSLLRNAKSLTYRIENASTGEAYYRKTVDYVSKSVYSSAYETILPAGAFTSDAIDAWYGTDSAGETLKDGTKVIVSIDAELDWEGFDASENENAHWEFPVTIDNTVPQIVSGKSDGQTLTLELKDNQYLAYVEVYDAEHMGLFSEPIYTQGFSSPTAGEAATIQVSVNGVETVYVGLADYGRNELVVKIDAATGQIIENSQFDYFEKDGEITITDYTGSDLEVVIPDEIAGYPVTGIDAKAFFLNKTVKSITLGKNIRTIGQMAFSRCDSLENILVDGENAYFKSIDGVLYTADGKTLLAYPNGKDYDNYPVASGTETIGSYAFFYAPVQQVFLPDSVKEIEAFGFYYATELTQVNFPKALTTIGDQAFFACYGLTELTIPATVTDLGVGVWAACTSLSAVSVAEENPNYSAVDGVLYTKDGKTLKIYPYAKAGTEFIMPETVETAEAYSFYYSTLTTVTPSAALRVIGDYAFYNCANLTAIPAGTALEEIGDYGFYSCESLPNLDLPDSMESVGDYAFAWCTGATSANLGNGLKTAGKYAYFYCSGLTSVTFGSSMDTIGNYAFYRCSKLATVDLGTSLRVIGDAAFSGCTKITAVRLPDSVRIVGSYAFNGCTAVLTLDLGQGVEEIGAFAFKGLKAVKTLTIPDSVKSIGSSAFYSMSALLELNLTPNTKQYGTNVFASATKLPSVVLPEGMTEIANGMFASCSALTSVTIPETVTVIQEGAFRSCKKLASIQLPKNLTYIGDSAFYYCSAIPSVVIPDQVTYVGEQAFRDLSSMTELTIGSSVETIGNFAFYGCTKITQVVLPDSVVSLGTSAFNKNSALKTVTFGTGLQSIGSMCFNMCYQLEAFQVPEGNTAFAAVDGILYSKTVDTLVWYPQGKTDTTYVMPETVKHIGPYGIYEVSALTSVTLASGLETIDEFGLARLNITGTLTIPATVNTIHFKAFLYDYSLQGFETPGENTAFQTKDGVLFTKDLSTLVTYPAGKPETAYTVPDGVQTVATYAFYYNNGLQTVDLNDVTMVETYAFYNAKGLEEADFGGSVVNVDAYGFSGCSNLKRLLASQALEGIGDSAFSGCGLEYVLLPAVKVIGASAFYNNRSMTRAVIGANVNAIYTSAFNYCSAMTETYFLGGQPENVGSNIFNKTASGFTVYYSQEQAEVWAPNGETKWGSYAIAPTTFYTVTFLDVDHSVLLEQPVALGHATIVPQDPSREEAPFIGWSADSSNVTEDLVILALYEGLTDTVTVTAQAVGNGTVEPAGTATYYYDGTAPYTFIPDEGYHVERVVVNGEDLGALDSYTFQNLRASSTIEVYFAINTYTVTYVDGLNGQIIGVQTVEHGSDAQAPAILPSHTGYHFTGWDDDGTAITADRTITAQYEVNTYTVRFLDHDGTELSVQTVAHGQAAQVPEAPAWEGHTFAGWSGDTSCVVTDLTIQALYTTNAYTIFFVDWDGTVLKTQEVSYGEAAQAPEVPAREGYTFTGWSEDFSQVTASAIVTAQYEINTYTVRFLDRDGSELSVQTVTYGSDAQAPQTPEHKGYRFTGWDQTFTQVQSDLTVTACYEGALPFADVEKNAWYYDEVLWAYANDIMQGITETTFDPDGSCTRAQFVTMLYRLSGETAPQGATVFTDVAQGRYYTEAVAWAYAAGIVQGTGSNTFSPDAQVTREQLVTFLYRYAQYQGMEIAADGSLADYPDEAQVSGWAQAAMAWAVGQGIIQGMDGQLAPKVVATRAQCAAFFMRFAAL